MIKALFVIPFNSKYGATKSGCKNKCLLNALRKWVRTPVLYTRRVVLPPTSSRCPAEDGAPACRLFPSRAYSDLIRLAVAPPSAAGPRLFSDVFRLVPSTRKHLGGEEVRWRRKRTFPPRRYSRYQQEETKFADSRRRFSRG